MQETRKHIIVNEGASGEDLSYYSVIRNTIHGLDSVIVNVIQTSITMITGVVGLGILVYEKLADLRSNPGPGLILSLIALWITFNSHERIKLYSGLLGKSVELAEEIERRIFPAALQLTSKLQREVEHAGIRGEKLYRRSVTIFYIIGTLSTGIFAWRWLRVMMN